jgi:hypothetical protein
MVELDFFMDKTIDILIATSLGIFIMVLHRRADKRVHKMIEDLHDYITIEHREVISKIHEMMEAEKKIDEDVHTMVLEQQKLIKELHELSTKDNKL